MDPKKQEKREKRDKKEKRRVKREQKPSVNVRTESHVHNISRVHVTSLSSLSAQGEI